MNRLGPEDYQSNRHIRKILNLAQAFKGDVFYDLGCGRGQLCVVAVAEFGVKRAVGIELHRGRAAKAAERIQEMGLTGRIEIRNEDFMESDLHDATIVYCGLGEVDEDVALFGRKLKTGCKIVSLFLPFVGILPAAADYPFLPHEGSLQEDEGCFSLDIESTLHGRLRRRTVPRAGYR